MINAKRAKELVEQSAEKMAHRMEKISEQIEKAAALGKDNIVLDWVLHGYPEFEVTKADYYPAEFTPLQKLIKAEIEKYGFTVRLAKQHHTGEGGFGQMEPVEPFDTHHIEVRW
jgi:protoheme ferro-lyase